MKAALHLFRVLILGAITLALASPAVAQSLPGAEIPEEEPVKPAPDPFGRETPRSMVTGLLQALGDADYLRAAQFFAMTADEQSSSIENAEVEMAPDQRIEEEGQGGGDPPDAAQRDLERAADLARKLQIALDRGGSLLPFPVLSNASTGVIDDGLAEDFERVGNLAAEEAGAPILLQQIEVDGTKQWRIASETENAIEQFVPAEAVEQVSAEEGTSVAGAPLLDWLKLIGLALLAFAAFRLLAALLMVILRRVIATHDTSPAYRFLDAAMPPLSLYLAVLTFYATADGLGVSIVARQTLLRYAAIVAWIALAWFALRLVDAIARIVTGRMHRAERRQAVTIVSFLRRGAKVVLLAIAVVAVLDTIGLDVTTGIAALGIGGLALALGAQKTIENLVGSVTLIADRPVQVGDAAQIGEVFGTIEDIGMRSTLVRTLDRTLVSIPNGYLASERIENYALRDRFLFHQTIGVTYDTSAEQMEQLLRELRAILADDGNIIDDDARVRFHGFGDSALQIEMFAYFNTRAYPESLAMQETLLFAVMRKLDELGIDFAFPTQTIHLQRDQEA
ncbi:Potassium efflux system KefA protein / Small-conductance mechanosensitive channel [Aurantiacibacter atlanticus]|uniref:Potassium efflux system KefA protein / Small-conductance mechanosensitive channel n=1 Tax=Aurantiacibacter atlanticus TaxID=1648404 RepID=A0A0H4VJ32_9SPHN|nr:mechanosensitive ion channel family protein [Aurantiacibacter atlanticus]AKQ42979.1 Potassium efflux system KefA protein / Small-conductance mechanosensitive channel [Aurantiacibacter atlanticus]MDF1835540.1 mechanosensitive ion channel family protein [Alteraurantiacibacter sp. bin_em_oilr2.035]